MAFNPEQAYADLALEAEQRLRALYPEEEVGQVVYFYPDQRDFTGAEARRGAFAICAQIGLPSRHTDSFRFYRMAALLWRLRRGWAVYGYEWRPAEMPWTPSIGEGPRPFVDAPLPSMDHFRIM